MRLKAWMLAGGSAIIIATPMAAIAQSQTSSTAAPQSSASSQEEGGVEQIIVSASRIDRAGFIAPSPTVVIGAELLQDRAAVNVADVINEVPSFRRSQAPESGGIGNSGANNADLRGLGAVRTLVLLDRMRLPAVNVPGSAVAGATDLNLIPSALIQRIDVVTGGASAAYGSDAVAGVLNLQLNTRLDGIKGSVQWGQTKYGDADDMFASLAFGTHFAGGRGRFVIGGEYGSNDGTDLFNDKRPWGRRNVSSITLPTNRAAGLPANLITDDVIFGMLTTGGLISPTAATNPAALRNLQFVVGPNGTVTTAPFNAGLYQGQIGTNMVGGTNVSPYQVLRANTQRYNLAAHAEYDLSDSLTLWARGLYSNTEAQNISAQIRAATGGTTGFLSISRNNPYLQQALTPAQLALIPANGSLTVGYLGNDFGPPILRNASKTYSLSSGLRGELGGSWRWDAAVQYGRNRSSLDQANTPITANFLSAVNAVTLNGQIVCANAAARAAGCQPINILGRASYSPAAYNYAFGTTHAVAETTLFEANANLNGDLFSLWAGPVSAGIGASYRRETFVTDADDLSQAGAFMARAPRDFPKASQSVKEAYLETIIPLLSADWVTGSLEFNGAIRLTDYSVSGEVTTWKAGLVWKPIPDILFRGTLSRDIRAPSLTELFTAAVATVPRPIYADPRAGFAGQPSYAYDVVTGGNAGLTPEIAKTFSVGAVFNPQFLSRLNISADYFQIKIQDAIGATGAGTSLTNCLGTGTADLSSPYCSLITFANNDPANGAVLSVLAQNANFAEFKTRGIDMALSYMQPVDEIFAGAQGRITLSAQATRTLEYRSTFDVSLAYPNGVNRAGQTGAIFGGTAGVPKWVVNTSLAYRGTRLETSVNFRWISRSKFNNAFIGPDEPGYSPTLINSINNNIVPARGYVNLSVAYNVGSQDRKVQIYGTVNNLLNQEPPLPAVNNNAWYDLLGQSFRVGVRFDL
ncbi:MULTISPECIES: TonB-dependent receptor plug domain-containing protein [unclassified Sphingobium]|uniref:TonB-dependent receptor plug domain-containing protein n=1 Tax=unclassified Sphingobium TaxID=2611147 RepID=UPI0022242FE3|nr:MULTISPECIES: TonB-dependent receptor [unclassified Sphingobium]MCW2380652.1 outer membrane receptor protein involved in Fe transport [Sphingobium sp. B2D3B]MCW2399240.1 outer membrane receptor protein involved in Fe transport [Sphingobium sp. B2D3C]